MRDADDKLDSAIEKQQREAYHTKRFDMMEGLTNSKKKVQDELEEYKKQFQVPGTQEVKLVPLHYPEEMAKERQLKIEADRVRRQIEFDKLEDNRKKALELNKESISKMKFEIAAECQDLNAKLEENYNNFMEVELREQFLIDERIKIYREMVDKARNDQMAIVQKITATAHEEEKKR